MLIELCVDQRALRRWHLELVERLGREPGIAVGIRWATTAAVPVPACVETLFSLERRLFGRLPGPSAPVEPGDFTGHVGQGGTQPDLVIDLSGGLPSAGRRRWRLTFDGDAGEHAALAALLAGRSPLVAVTEAETGRVVANGRVGSAAPAMIVASFEELLGRTTTLLLSAIGHGGPCLDLEAEPPEAVSCGQVAVFASRSLARAARDRIASLIGRPTQRRAG